MRSPIASIAIVVCTSLTTVTPAQAADTFYGGAALGLSSSPDTKASGTSGGTVQFDNSTVGAAFVGYDFANNWHIEGELSRRAAGLNTVAGTAASGETLVTSLMVNAIYDLDLDLDFAAKPYVGVGAGVSSVEMDNATPFGGSTLNTSDTVGAVQAIVGISYALNDQIDLFTDYRYFTTAKADFSTQNGAKTSMDYSAHSAMIGVKFSFGGASTPHALVANKADTSLQAETSSLAANQAEPSAGESSKTEKDQEIASAAPAYSATETYVVHFALNKADMSPEAVAVIEDVAAKAKAMQLIRIDLSGHTDSAGDANYNLALSKRRAETVKTAFVALGFQASEIFIKAMGEAEPLIATPDNAYQPKNRRVEIVLP
ncbi:OmpA family protein [Magnetovibrio blakemorei]|uniref:OmpA-like domain-containing protein n=1 Tax=Magnetovibrio blakemorei TaxID=28181 RepID=A0A1E5Q8F1_9PROT|nr:OmpA family protein [Magnetovibrio blakemorei]OEJ67542.1 hypothetical protein BEN30_08900 [Magnetovibrio blakemorei]